MQFVKVYAGESLQTFQFQFTVNGKGYDLTGTTLTGVLRRTDLSAPTDSAVTGNLVILGGTTGLFTFQPSTTDLVTPGVYELQPIATSAARSSRGQVIFITALAQR